MKSKYYFAIVFSVLAFFTFCATSQAKPLQSYEGRFDTWSYEDGVLSTNAKIVSGFWQFIPTKGDWAWFYAQYRELNVNEETPGTYDNFTIFMATTIWEPIPNGYNLEGTSYLWKNGELTYQFDTTITIDSEDYETQLRIDFKIAPENIVQIFGSLLP
jgi:hypothetical protein